MYNKNAYYCKHKSILPMICFLRNTLKKTKHLLIFSTKCLSTQHRALLGHLQFNYIVVLI